MCQASFSNYGNLEIHRGANHIPHWEWPDAIYHVCFRLHDSVPQSKRQEWLRLRTEWRKIMFAVGMELSPEEQCQVNFIFAEKIDQYLASGYGECWLKQPSIAGIMQSCLREGDGHLYHLCAWCIMPNHVHVLLRLLRHSTLTHVVQRWKSFSAHCINRQLGREGKFWQADFYNRIVRGEEEYRWLLEYIWNNPDKAGLQNWLWRWRSE